MSSSAGKGFGSRLRRRVVTLPLVVTLCVSILVLWPILAVTSVLVGVFRRRQFALLRTFTVALAYAVMELWGLAALALVWVSSGFGLAPVALEARAFWVQRHWLRGLWWAARRCFGLRVKLDAEDLPRGPIIVFARHTSMLDVLIPGNYVLGPQRQLRWVLKKELLAEPCLDIAGHWMPNHFVDRSGDHSDTELAAIESLARDLRSDEGAIIFPEGTRFTQGRRARVIERLEASSSDPLDYARSLVNLLPPRTGGSRALMRGAPDAQVVFVAHHGLEGSRSWGQLISGRLVGRELSIRVWSEPRSDTDFEAWLREQWAGMDGWIAARASAN